MYKLVIWIGVLSLLSSCSESGQVQIEMNKNKFVVDLVPSNPTTSNCKLLLTGNIDCPILINIESEKSIILKPGPINFSRNYEWYEKGKKITFNTDSCTVGSSLILKYRFSSGYFGNK